MPFEYACQCLFAARFRTTPSPAENSPETTANMIPQNSRSFPSADGGWRAKIKKDLNDSGP